MYITFLRRGMNMTTTVRPTNNEIRQSVNDYIRELDAMDEDEAKKVARETLIRTGVLDATGRPKPQIVTGDFFGW